MSAAARHTTGRPRNRTGIVSWPVAAVLASGLVACAAPAPSLSDVEIRADVAFVGAPSPGGDPFAPERSAALSRLGTELLATTPGKNTVVSPLSVLLAFAMLREGASGATAAQLDEVFGFDAAAPGEAIAALRASLARHDGDVSEIDRDEPPARPLLHVADALFVAPDAAVTDGFLERIARFHDAGVFEADFRGGKAKRLLDAWVERETGGLVEKAPSEPDPETQLALLNAVVFAAQWEQWFVPDATSDAPFTLPDGTVVTVDMMAGLFDVRYSEGPGWRAVALPYTADFAMLLALPDDGGAQLTAVQWDEVRAALDPARPGDVRHVMLWMPRWELDAHVDLRAALAPLGLERVFEDTGGLDGVFPGAYVAAAAHSATITVAEKGTVAAAVTQLDVAGTAAPEIDVELRLDRPFDFQIVTTRDLIPVFAGHVADPRG